MTNNENPKYCSTVFFVENIEKSKKFYTDILGQKIKMDFGRCVEFIGGFSIWERSYAQKMIGIKDFKPKLINKYKWETDVESELVFMFLTHSNQNLKVNTEEVDEGKFWRIKEVQRNLGKGVFTPNFELEFEMLKKII